MFRVKTLLALSVLAAGDAASAAESSRYGGWQERSITALSPEQIEDYLEGRGMGMALPAELNGYPGPRHVLELADELDLTPDQRATTEQLFEDMRRKAIDLGEQIVEREAALDELFASGTASAAALHATTEALGRLNGRLRAHHLSYHLGMRDILDPFRIEMYSRLQGYAPSGRPGGHRHGHDRHGGQ
jgi:Spy/CpxP family protein refolding chaperone